MTKLSFTTVDNLYKASHTWTNKINGVTTPDRSYYEKGKEIHQAIQNHFLGINPLEYRAFKGLEFEIVERMDFDPACYVTYQLTDDYMVHGYVDGIGLKNQTRLEIKSGTSFWSLLKYKKSMQRKTYDLCLPNIKTDTLITVLSNMNAWRNFEPKVISLSVSEQDRIDAKGWFMGAVEIIENGDFSGGLDEDGYCTGCNYAENCLFYRNSISG